MGGEKKYYSIKEAAKKINRSVYTLNRYINEGLITPVRNDRGFRYFTEEDIIKLEEIKEHKIEIMMSGGEHNGKQSTDQIAGQEIK